MAETQNILTPVQAEVRVATGENAAMPSVLIEPKSTWALVDWRECVEYRDLLYFLVLRDVTVLYKQTVLGIMWALLNPFFSMIVFTVIFGTLMNGSSDGKPKPVFYYAALLPWTYFSQSLSGATNSLIQGTGLFSKVYFPRVFIPTVPIFSKLVDFGIASLLLVGLMIWYHVSPTWNVVFLPLLILVMMVTSAGIGMLLSALTIQYRDIRHAMSFLIQAMMYAAPVAWPVSSLAKKFPDLLIWYGLYPMAGVIEGFRAALLGTGPMPWGLIGMGSITAVVFFVVGSLYFRRTERIFADVA